MRFNDYSGDGFCDEMIGEDGQPRAAARLLARQIESLPAGELEEELVVKAANESGGYGMLVGPHASREKIEEFRKRIQAHFVSITTPTNLAPVAA